MKKLFLAGALALGILGTSAQSKIGYISTDELVGEMPEASKLDSELKDFQASLAQQGQDMMQDLTRKDSTFSKDSSKLSPSMKEIKRNELIGLYQQVQGWNQQAQEIYQQEAQKKIAPLRNKALDAIRAVAKENGYAYILDMNSVIVAPPGDDVLPLVRKKLGIKDAPKTTAAPATNKPAGKN
jgi:outer membrane protein